MQFLQFAGLTAEVKLRLEEGMEEAYSFEKPKTKWFSPSPAFAKASMESAEARDFLDVAGTRTPLYMVTGVKVVTGGSITTTRNKGHAYDWEFGVDGTPVGAPVLAGPYFERTNAGLETSYRKETPIVVAYQLMQVKLKDSTSMATPYSRGAISEFGDGKEEELMEVELSDISLEPGYKHEEDQEEFLDGAFTLSSHAEGSQDSCVVVVPDTIYVYGKSDIESGAAFNAPLNIGFISRNISGPSNASNFEKSRENFEVVRSSLPEVQANENRTNDGKLQMWYGDIIAKINDALSNGKSDRLQTDVAVSLDDILLRLELWIVELSNRDNKSSNGDGADHQKTLNSLNRSLLTGGSRLINTLIEGMELLLQSIDGLLSISIEIEQPASPRFAKISWVSPNTPYELHFVLIRYRKLTSLQPLGISWWTAVTGCFGQPDRFNGCSG